MYEGEPAKAALEGFEVEMRMDCTVRVGGADSWDFIKPGVSTKVHFSSIPSEEQLRLSMEFMNTQIINPTLEDVIVEVQKKLKKARGGS